MFDMNDGTKLIFKTLHAISKAEQAGGDGETKKQMAISLLDAVLEPVDLPFVPNFIENPIKRVVVEMLIDGLVALLNHLGLWERIQELPEPDDA